MSAFTPGPWEVTNGWTGYPSHITAPGADDTKPGAVGSRITRQGSISLPSSEEGQANARLIAAAPDLLAMLISLHSWGGFDNVQKLSECHELIARATGAAQA